MRSIDSSKRENVLSFGNVLGAETTIPPDNPPIVLPLAKSVTSHEDVFPVWYIYGMCGAFYF